MIKLQLTHGMVALVDDEDALLAKHKWFAYKCKKDKTYYARRNTYTSDGRRTTILLHQEVGKRMWPEWCGEVDHIDNDGLDCCRSNLRPATRADNVRNTRLRSDNTSGFKGVYRNGSKWGATIQFNKKRTFIGNYFIAEDAARAYDVAAKRLFGEFANLNFKVAGT